ncbi:hypothetical protein HANVADRAFT_47246 [Hanseniaspora valbyensis NRRL Y-1626]|uniref:Uncharacterized protein n=1 Tax=Hanseniaspora valbyensis NRRL Y-1626 TaxID=766949 RepID=A0A1B7TIL3_9ASCO|nr:hypothetical protein HANVADRAFT_47246 [Hanseniaspora valbyensis NRRL Y-1626]
MLSTNVSVYNNTTRNSIIKSLLFSYKQAFKACDHDSNINIIAIDSYRKSVKLKINEINQTNSFLPLSDIKQNCKKDLFFDKTPDYITKNVKSLILTNQDKPYNSKKKQYLPVNTTIENEVIELITDLNYLSYLFKNSYTTNDTVIEINKLIVEKNKRENVFSQAFDNDEIKKLIKIQIESAEEHKNKVPNGLKKNFDILLDYIKMKYDALNDSLLEDNHNKYSTSLFVIPYTMKARLKKICRPNYKPKMSVIERHKHAIKQLNRIILRLQTGPKVRIIQFKTAVYPMSLPIANTEKNAVFDNKMHLFFTGLRYQTFLTKNYNSKRFFLSDDNAFISFLQNLDDIHFNENNTNMDINLNELYWRAYMNEDTTTDLTNYLENIKDNIEWLTNQNEKIKSFFTKNLSKIYLEQYKKDYSNNLELLKKYEALDLETVNPYDSKNDLDSRIIENNLIDQIVFFDKFGTVISLFFKYIKLETINYNRVQRE